MNAWRSNFVGAEPISLSEFVEQTEKIVVPGDLNSLSRVSPLLAGLACNRRLLIEILNRHTGEFFQSGLVSSASTFTLGHGTYFELVAIAWPPDADVIAGRFSPPPLSYGKAHDCSKDRMVVGYSGPGYHEDLYSYDRNLTEGYPNESVVIAKIDDYQLSPGTIVLHPRFNHIHVRQAPESLSYSLELVVSRPKSELDDTYWFDIQSQRIVEIRNRLSEIQSSLLHLLSLSRSTQASTLLRELATVHPHPHVRRSAQELLSQRVPADNQWEIG